ncbi:MAG: tyrosine-protein phosphatase [Sphingobium sp.]
MTVQPAFIDSCFAAINDRYGDLHGYFRRMRIEPAMIDRMRDRPVI